MIQKIIIISFHHVDWSVSLPLSHGIIFRRPSALDKLGAVLFQHGEAVYSLVLPTGPHYFPTLAVTPGRIGQRLWTVTRADDYLFDYTMIQQRFSSTYSED
ncbi:unnamed protein product [Caenorhabditis auriculariae]|uniref:Uncharacterized protein n=1 Tax=Caenorhabditis auriculariae TaxID=2777116 RepID=A0A8S1H3S7_9PELO|nr:unnamed protein product [Caenorhabditis auriculariae]